MFQDSVPSSPALGGAHTCTLPHTCAPGAQAELTMSWKELAKGETPGLAGVQVGQREAQHTQRITWLAVLQERQDAV